MGHVRRPVPWFQFDATVGLFEQALYDHGRIVDFDWPAWEAAETYVTSLNALASADAATIQNLLTTHVRSDRFCEGHLAAMFDNGHIVAVLSRLKQLRQAIAGS